MRKFSLLILIIITILTLCAGCSNSNSVPAPLAPDDGFTSSVVNKEIKSNKYILEISSQGRHEYVEIALEHWDQIAIGDSVSFSTQYELTRINNREVD